MHWWLVPDPFFALSPPDQADALAVAASRSGKPAHLLEKDIWVVWTLRALFGAPFGHDLVFKGGTSLWVGNTVSSLLNRCLGDEGLSARVTVEADTVQIAYEPRALGAESGGV